MKILSTIDSKFPIKAPETRWISLGVQKRRRQGFALISFQLN